MRLEVAVSVDARSLPITHNQSTRCRPVPVHNGAPRAVEPAGEARELLKCVQLRALQRKLTSPAISYSFQL